MGSNALNALLSKAFSERSEDFSAAQRRESIGIFVVWVGRPGGPVCRPYENTKACPVNAVGAGHWPTRRGASAIPEPTLIRLASLGTFPLEGGRLACDRKGRPYGFTKVHLSNRRAGEGTRPYGGNQTGSVGSAEPGAKVEPQQRQFSTQTGRRRRPPTQSPAKRVCVGEEERWSERALSGRTKRGIRNPRRRSGPGGIAETAQILRAGNIEEPTSSASPVMGF